MARGCGGERRGEEGGRKKGGVGGSRELHLFDEFQTVCVVSEWYARPVDLLPLVLLLLHFQDVLKRKHPPSINSLARAGGATLMDRRCDTYGQEGLPIWAKVANLMGSRGDPYGQEEQP